MITGLVIFTLKIRPRIKVSILIACCCIYNIDWLRMENAHRLVMLVDDNDTDNFISQRIIQITEFSAEVVVKNSGKSALEYLEQNADKPENLPEIIFLDINMPIVDGFVFLYEFEKFPDTIKSHSKIIILSSSDNRRDIDKIIDNDYVIKFITKPLTEDALEEIKALATNF